MKSLEHLVWNEDWSSPKRMQQRREELGPVDDRIPCDPLSPADGGSSSSFADDWQRMMDGLNASEEKARKTFREAVGRGGMRAGDCFAATFVMYPVYLWTLKELKNRIAWLKRERGRLLGKPNRKGELAKNAAKLQKYTHELFKRYSPEGITKTRDEHNRLRRSRRKIAKQRKIAALMRTYKEKKLVERLAAKVVKILDV